MQKIRTARPRSPLSEAHRVLRSFVQRHPEEKTGVATVLATLAGQEMELKDAHRKVAQHVGLDLFRASA